MELNSIFIIFRENSHIAKEEAIRLKKKLTSNKKNSAIFISNSNDESLNLLFTENKLLPDLVVVLGGDGTVLKAAKYIASHKIPILSFNVGGHLGFLTHDKKLLAKDCFWDQIHEDSFEIEQRMMLQATIKISKNNLKNSKLNSKPKSFWALNDFYIRAFDDEISPTCTLELEIDGENVDKYRGDGLILSTPTGSTAYAMASGGPILHPTIEAIIVSPICPMSLASRPIVVPAASQLTITPCIDRIRQVKLWQDGAASAVLEEGDKCIVKRAENNALMVVLQDSPSYYRSLAQKLYWAGSLEKFKPSSL